MFGLFCLKLCFKLLLWIFEVVAPLCFNCKEILILSKNFATSCDVTGCSMGNLNLDSINTDDLNNAYSWMN